MEKEELVEMINSTINTNGSGAITGEALNLALQAIVEAMGTGSGSGAERLQGYFDGSAWVQTDEEKALNAQLYTKIVSALANDEPISVLCILKTSSEGMTSSMTSIAVMKNAEMVNIIFIEGTMIISSDGSVTAQVGG